MTTHIEVAELGPKWESLVDDLAENGGEISLTRDGKAIARLIRADNTPAAISPSDGFVLYDGRWMIPAAAERERSMEHLRGSGKILGDIVSPILESDGALAGSILYQGDIVSPLDAEWKANTLNEWEQAIGNLIRSGETPDIPPMEGLVLYKGEWMIPAAAERERSIEHLRGSGKILGDIVSPIDDLEWDALK